MSREPNDRVVGEIEPEVWIPVPSSGIDTSAAFECTVAVPVRGPVAVGTKVNRKVQLSPSLRVDPMQLLLGAATCWKPPVITFDVRVTVCVPEFVMVTSWGLVAPSSMSFEPKD